MFLSMPDEVRLALETSNAMRSATATLACIRAPVGRAAGAHCHNCATSGRAWGQACRPGTALGRELLGLAVPWAEQVAFDQLAQLVTDLVRARTAELLRGVQWQGGSPVSHQQTLAGPTRSRVRRARAARLITSRTAQSYLEI